MALEVERCIDKGLAIVPRAKAKTKTFGDLIRLHVSDLLKVGKPIRRSKAGVLRLMRTHNQGCARASFRLPREAITRCKPAQIEIADRLFGEDKFRFLHKAACKRHALLPAAAQRIGALCGLGYKACVYQRFKGDIAVVSAEAAEQRPETVSLPQALPKHVVAQTSSSCQSFGSDLQSPQKAKTNSA